MKLNIKSDVQSTEIKTFVDGDSFYNCQRNINRAIADVSGAKMYTNHGTKLNVLLNQIQDMLLNIEFED